MGARQSRGGFNQWDTNNIQSASGLPADQIRQLQQQFFQSAGQDGLLNMNEFANVYARFAGGRSAVDGQQIERIFRTFDRDRTGALSFDEFLSAVIMLNHDMPRRDRIEYVINQNNYGGRNDGRISAQYGHQVFRRLNDYYGLPAGTEHQCWKQVDQQNRGYVTQQELMNYIGQQQAYSRRYQ